MAPMNGFFEFLADLFGTGLVEAERAAGAVVKRNLDREVPVVLYNTLSSSLERFEPQDGRTVKMYNCGPTVYGPQHIGNLSMFVFTDVLRRMLEYNDYAVKQVINFTDVGHLSSDEDEGEDKMTKGLKREGLALTLDNMHMLARRYADAFKKDLAALNINTDRITFPYASEYIQAQVAMIRTLEKKGFAYATSRGVHFDTARFPAYGHLGNINLKGLKEGARIEADSEKRNSTDFNLWKLDSKLGWNSPWGRGFPGWHIECSAMIHELLGEPIDIHTGGIEHIPVHHNNEIAQSQCAFEKPLARFWLHREHIQMHGGKMAKSEGNVLYLADITAKGFDPLALRYFYLSAQYRSSSNFSWEALEGARNALTRLREIYYAPRGGSDDAESYLARFHDRINDDLDTPGALAVLWEMTRDERVDAKAKRAAASKMDDVLGIGILRTEDAVPAHVQTLASKRETARKAGNWSEADALRAAIETSGYTVKDTESGPHLSKKS